MEPRDFYYKHAPYIYGPGIDAESYRNFLADSLAEDEATYKEQGYNFRWEAEVGIWPRWHCHLYKEGKRLLSIGGVDLGQAGVPQGTDGRMIQMMLYQAYKNKEDTSDGGKHN